MAHADTVRIFDTTLRDGEQSPGFTMNGAVLKNRWVVAVERALNRLQTRNRQRLVRMLPAIAHLALLGTLLLGLYQVLRLEPSRKRLPRAS